MQTGGGFHPFVWWVPGDNRATRNKNKKKEKEKKVYPGRGMISAA